MKPVFLALLASGCSLAVPDGSAATPVREIPTVTTDALVSLPDVAERVVKGVVAVNTQRSSGGEVKGMGSGVIVDGTGTVVTNHHVIDGALSVRVTLSDGKSYGVELVGSDPRSDVAVLRIVDPPKHLDPLTWGDSDAVRLGETVVAVGNPYGIGHTLTRGIVSAKGRARVGVAEYEDFIQTDAAINPGNSGGALVDLNGDLVGIPTAIFSKTGGFSGISFAIPSRMARAVTEDILEDGRVDRGWLGVVLADTEAGVVLTEINDGGAASAAGLMPGDIVVSFNGSDTRTMQSFRAQVAFTGAGQPFRAVVLRDGTQQTLEGVLGRRPDDPLN
ncbi:MAG: trypsin-like peptidase domain-containing protein [Myxococcota bacterium]